MGKTGVRSLPPLVYGKLTGVLEFIVDKVEITEKIFKNENCNILVKIIWWGETKPLFIRPKLIKFITKDDKQVVRDEAAGHSIEYEVHTNPKLFKSYLEKCEIVELVILNATQHEVIGSTFLRNLTYLVFNTQLFTGSIINHSGNPIGEISCQFFFKETNLSVSQICSIPQEIKTSVAVSPLQKWCADDLKINLNSLDLGSPKDKGRSRHELFRMNYENSLYDKAIKDDFHSQRSSNVHYNSPVTQNSALKSDDLQAADMRKYSEKTNEIMDNCLGDSDLIHSDYKDVNIPPRSGRSEKSTAIISSKCVEKVISPAKPTDQRANVKDKKKIVGNLKRTCSVNNKQEENASKHLSHSSKLINKKAATSKVKSYMENKTQKHKNIFTNKAFAGAKIYPPSKMTCKNSSKNTRSDKILNAISKRIMKPTGNIRTFEKVSNEISKLNKLYLNSSQVSCNNHSDLEHVPVKENIQDVRTDYSQDREECEETNGKAKGLEQNIKIMGSSENYKSIISNNEEKKSNKIDNSIKKSETPQDKVNVDSKLYFDLNDPVEKIYYETFFLQTKNLCNNEFEIAELLNQPENKYILEVTSGGSTQRPDSYPFGERSDVPKSESDIFCSDKTDRILSEDKSVDPAGIRKTKEYSFNKCESVDPNKGPPEDFNCVAETNAEYKADCHRCTYYKKLNELDKIIEALKNFESRLKNDNKLSGESLDVDDCQKDLFNDRQHPILSRYNPPDQTVKEKYVREDNSDEEPALRTGIDESDFSKEDSDFIEFTHYLSKR